VGVGNGSSQASPLLRIIRFRTRWPPQSHSDGHTYAEERMRGEGKVSPQSNVAEAARGRDDHKTRQRIAFQESATTSIDRISRD
jgi:hypothetical protein